MARTRKTHRTTQTHVEHQDATDIQKKTCLCVFKAQLIKICITLLLFFYIIVAAADTRSFKINNEAQEQKQLNSYGFVH